MQDRPRSGRCAQATRSTDEAPRPRREIVRAAYRRVREVREVATECGALDPLGPGQRSALRPLDERRDVAAVGLAGRGRHGGERPLEPLGVPRARRRHDRTVPASLRAPGVMSRATTRRCARGSPRLRGDRARVPPRRVRGLSCARSSRCRASRLRRTTRTSARRHRSGVGVGHPRAPRSALLSPNAIRTSSASRTGQQPS